MKKFKIAYLISTGLLTALMSMSIGMYLFNHAAMETAFTNLGYPTYIIYPLAFLKIAGLGVIWLSKNKSLREWAYSGFFFNFVLAFFAHFMIGDGEFPGALMALTLLFVSYITGKKMNHEKS